MVSVMRETQTTKHTHDEYEEGKSKASIGEARPLAIHPELTKEQQYPTLSQVALDTLSIPASSADCERTFNELGDLLGVRRLRMLPDLLFSFTELTLMEEDWYTTSRKLPKTRQQNTQIARCRGF
jgi:hypothetical protein